MIRHAVVAADWRIRPDPADTLERLKQAVADQEGKRKVGVSLHGHFGGMMNTARHVDALLGGLGHQTHVESV